MRFGKRFLCWLMCLALLTGVVWAESADDKAPASYTVYYYANGGTGAPPNQTKIPGTPVTLSAQQPTREGWSFLNWNTAADGSGSAWAPGAVYAADADLYLYAQWQRVTYAVTYYGNGGTGVPASQLKNAGEALRLSDVIPTRNGYAFLHWSTQADGSGTLYSPGDIYNLDAPLALYAIWQARTYTVRFHPNGGFGAPADQQKIHGTALTLTSQVPSREGYAFVEWNTAADGSGTAYMPGGTFTRDADTLLYAIWRQMTYTVTYDANGGTGAPAVQTKKHGEPLTLTTETPRRSGYQFDGWNTAANGSGTSYAPGGTYTADVSVTLYAIWRRTSFTVKYHPNGGVGAPADQTKEYGVALTLSSQQPTRQGYAFVSWNTAMDGSGATYAPGASYTQEADVTLYAVWNRIRYTVTYDANGGTGAPAAQTRSPGESLILTTELPTRAGYTFVEWNTSSLGGGTAYQPGGVYTADASVTLYAIWQARAYVISYDANGGEKAPASQLKTHGAALTLTSELPVRAGWTFSAWNTRADGSGTAYAPGASFTQDADTTLYAIWRDRMVTLTYDANGGVNPPAAQTVAAGSAVTVSFDIPSRTGYSFVKWNTSPAGSGTTRLAGEVITLDENTTLYAIWKQLTVTVFYETFGLSEAPPADTVALGGLYMVSNFVPTRPGYVFSSWNTEPDGSGTSYAPGATLTAGGNLTLFAIWQQSLFTVHYDANGGVNPPADQQKTLGVPLTLTDAMPLRPGHTFQCWNTSPGGSGTFYASGASYTAEADVTLYAVWLPDTFTVTFDANGGTGAPPPQTKTYGVTLYLSTVKPTRAGCVFTGWGIHSDGSGQHYPSGGAFDTEADTTLFAIWDEITYTVHYDANGGINAPADQTKTQGVSLTLSSQKPDRPGYVFVEWNTAKDGAGTSFLPGAVFSQDADTTLYAQWNPEPVPPPSALSVMETALSFSISPDGKSIFMDQPTIITHQGPVTYAYNCYDDDGKAVNYYYSGASRTAMTPGRNGHFNVYCVVKDSYNSVTSATGWVDLTGYAPSPLQVAETTAVCALSPDKHSLFIDRPTISGGTGHYTVAYNCYDEHSNPVNYYYSAANRTAMTPGYAGRFCVFVVVSDGNTSVTIHTGWWDVQ